MTAKKRSKIAFFMAMLMILSLMPAAVPVRAADLGDGMLYVGGVDIIKDGTHDVQNNTYTISVGQGGAAILSYDGEAGNEKPVLTLSGIDYTGVGHAFEYSDENYRYPSAAAIYYSGDDPLTLTLTDKNTFNLQSTGKTHNFGIYTSKAITVNGEGSLDGKVSLYNTAQTGWGMYVGGDMTYTSGTMDLAVDIKEGVDIDKTHSGIESKGDLSISGGNLTLNNKGYGNGIKSAGKIEVTGGVLTATGGNYGINCNGKVTVSDGEVMAYQNGDKPNQAFGIWCKGVDISGGTVKAISAKGSGSGDTTCPHGIYSKGRINISGGKVTAVGGTNTATNNYAYSIGIHADVYCENDSDPTEAIIISGGTVEATGGDSTVNDATSKIAADSMGLYGLINCGTSTRKEDYHGVLISGGTVNATGGTSTAKKYSGSSGGSKAYATSSGIAGCVLYCPEANAYAVELKDDAKVKATGGEVSGPGWDNASRGVRILPESEYSSSLKYYGLVIGEVDKEAVEISGQTNAIYGQVFNAVSGTGWSNAEGTQGRTEIAVCGEGRELNYKKTVFAAAGGVDPTSVPAPIGKELTYNGKAQTGVDEGEGYTLSGTYSATNAGSYQATATLKDGYIWSDGTSEAKNIVWKINKANVSVTVPAGKSYTYDGKKKTGVAAGDGYTLSGTASATNAGNYSAKATLVNDPNRTYKWSDGTNAAKTISWKINKADNTMTAAAAKATLSVTYNADKAVTTVKSANVEKAKGAVKFTNASTNATAKKFKVDEKNSKITVPKGTKANTYKVKIKVTAAASDNYKSASKTVSFNVKVKQADNPLAIKAKKKSYPFTYSKKKAQTLKAKDAYTISKKGKGKVTYTLASAKNKKGTNVKNKFKVDKSTGNVTLKKDLAKSTYTVKVKVKAEGNNNYKGATKDVQIKIVVK